MIKTYKSREKYIKKIEPFMGKDGLIKVLMGQRRVGKSYILLELMDTVRKKYGKNEKIISINKELHEFDEIKTGKDLITYVNKKAPKNGVRGGGKRCIFIDEIQEIQDFEKGLRALQAEGKTDIYCTGSNADILSGELATHLSGRYVAIEIFSLSYTEFLFFHELQENEDSFLKYIRYGGLPYLIHLELEDQIVYEYLKNIVNTIIYKDVVARFGVRNVNFLERLVEYVADNVGSLVSAKKISDFLKSQKTNISSNVVMDYLSYLVAAFIIFEVPRSEIGGKKIFEINKKYYFEDLGLRHAITGYTQKDIGKVLENLVFSHLKRCGYRVTVGKLQNREIDFVCEKNGEKVYIQVCYLLATQEIREREFGNLLKIPDNERKIVVSMDPVSGGKEKGIEHIHIREFLLGDM